MKIKYIVLDANILIKNYNFDSEDLIQLIKMKDFFGAKLCLPKVVYDECIGNYSKDINECHNSLKSSLLKYKNVLVDIKKTKFETENILNSLSKMSVYYKTALDLFIKNNNIELIDYPNVSHQDVVNKIYKRTLPFGKDKCSEKGYKDYLILCSIKNLQGKTSPDESVIIYTKNLSDFLNGNAKNINDRMPHIERECELENVYVTSKVDLILSEFSKNLKLKNHNDLIKDTQKLADLIGDAILGESIINDEIYGDTLFQPKNIRKKISTLSDFCVNIDEDANFLELTGKCKIQFLCDFELNSFFDVHNNEEFVFYDKVASLIKGKNYLEDDFWEFEFSDFSYCRTFDFTYADYDFKKDKELDNLNDGLIMISRSDIVE
ncbi:PIN domain-containing protein [Aeromonas dhakensis]|uniref:PIN domain-containing protein n=1 Tax=Aeromonas dhakensis TaxID=196024 RepID=UPI00244B0664|nr:PIN domain-containing protein [Aeromonas dhakensis]MDH0345722.1 PIN domain-containing protein [Aeromonas dhakensis]